MLPDELRSREFGASITARGAETGRGLGSADLAQTSVACSLEPNDLVYFVTFAFDSGGRQVAGESKPKDPKMFFLKLELGSVLALTRLGSLGYNSITG